MNVYIERIEENTVVLELEDSSTVTVSRSLFPNAKEGEVYTVSRNTEEEKKREDYLQSLKDSLFE